MLEKRRLFHRLRRWALWSVRELPPGARLAAGALLVAAGLFGFLPVLGFWMIPLGVMVMVLDVPPLRKRVLRWLAEKDRDQHRAFAQGPG